MLVFICYDIICYKALKVTGNFQTRTYIARRVDNKSLLIILNHLLPELWSYVQRVDITCRGGVTALPQEARCSVVQCSPASDVNK